VNQAPAAIGAIPLNDKQLGAELERLGFPSGPCLLNKKQLGERLGLTVRGVECLMAKRKIPVIRLGHKTVKFSWPKVEAALAKLEIREV